MAALCFSGCWPFACKQGRLAKAREIDDPDHVGSAQSYAVMQGASPDAANRFQLMSDREVRSELTKKVAERLLEAQEFNRWRGVHLSKCCYDMNYYPMLIQELKPRTILEAGSFRGASAAWLSDVAAASLGQGACKVISYDITLENVPEGLRGHPDIEFVEAANARIVSVLGAERLRQLPRPLLVIEDAHYEFKEWLESLHPLLQQGDYLVVEDTNAVVHQVWQDEAWLSKMRREGQMEENRMCERKRETLRDFCVKHQDLYRVDAHYQDMFGYNVGKLQNSIVKRIA